MTGRRRLGSVLAAVALAATACTGDLGLPTPPTPLASTSTAPASSTPSTGEAFRDTRVFALSAASGRVVGLVGSGSRAVDLELEGSASGGDQRVRVTSGDGRTAEVLTVGLDHWLSGNEAFWTARTGSATKARAVAGGYVPVDADEAAEVAPYTLRDLLSEAFARPAVAALEGGFGPAADDEVDGTAAWVIGDTGGPRLWVAADGSAELLRLVVPGSDALDLVFSQWGRVEPLNAPAPADVRSL